MSEDGVERAVVKTYVPAYQKEAWVEHADELDMSQSEFLRTMVQAGRRDFAVDPYPELDGHGPTNGPGGGTGGPDTDGSASTSSQGASEGVESGFEDRVYGLLLDETLSWDELLEAITDDVEARLEDALQSLQAENRVVYSGRNGGYEAIDG